MKPADENGEVSILRRLNTRAILEVLRSAEAQTLTEVARRTGLSRQTVDAVIGDLTAQGLVAEVAPTEGGAGRPARRFGFRRRAGHVLGVDIGVRHVFAVVADLNGEPVTECRLEADERLGASERLSLAERAARTAAGDADVPGSGIWSAAAGTSGVVDRSGRVTLSTLLPFWTGLDLASRVAEWFGCPALAANDANLAVVAEHWRGNARHVADVVYVLTGHRAGHGLLLGGRLHTGRTGSAGELGRLPLAEWDDPAVVLERDGRTADEVFTAARHGDADSLGTIDRIAYALAMGAAANVMVIDPELVVLGGPYARAADLLLRPMKRHLDAMCRDAPEVAASAFGEESIALGAIRLALDRVERTRLDLG